MPTLVRKTPAPSHCSSFSWFLTKVHKVGISFVLEVLGGGGETIQSCSLPHLHLPKRRGWASLCWVELKSFNLSPQACLSPSLTLLWSCTPLLSVISRSLCWGPNGKFISGGVRSPFHHHSSKLCPPTQVYQKESNHVRLDSNWIGSELRGEGVRLIDTEPPTDI